MATSNDPVKAEEREVMQDISYFEGYDLPATPPETPPTKSDGTMVLKERTEMHSTLERMFPNTPPGTPPRLGLKRSFSSNVKSFSSFGPLTPPATPPTRLSGLGLSRTLSDKVFEHQVAMVRFISAPGY
jgi:hypothetical protein